MQDVYVRKDRLWVSYVNEPYAKVCQHLHTQEIAEANYKQIAAKIDNDFLQQKLRSAALDGVKLAGVQDRSLVFYINSANKSENDTVYTNIFRIKEWDSLIDEQSLSPIQRARQLMFDGNLELHCTCPSFLFWGYQYLLTQIDAALMPEGRPPVKKNPNHRGIVCKHLHRTIKTFPFYASDLAKYIRQNNAVADVKKAVVDKKSKKADQIKADPEAEADFNEVV